MRENWKINKGFYERIVNNHITGDCTENYDFGNSLLIFAKNLIWMCNIYGVVQC